MGRGKNTRAAHTVKVTVIDPTSILFGTLLLLEIGLGGGVGVGVVSVARGWLWCFFLSAMAIFAAFPWPDK